jgi:hypothetical protein
MLKKIKGKLFKAIEKIAFSVKYDEKCAQLVLSNQYKEMSMKGLKCSFSDIGFRKYSQNSEDGILLYIFSLIGTTNKTCVEICAGNGVQNNTANLIINHGWNGLLFDGDRSNIDRSKEFYSAHPDTYSFPPKIVHAWITKNNVNELIEKAGVKGEVDLLCIDIDGIDYWLWEAIDIVNPIVLVAEIQCIWGSEKSVTVPYSDDFKTKYIRGYGVYSGASLSAFVKLSKRKGYRLIGVEKYGFNAFFMRDGIGLDLFPELTADECLDVPFAKWANQELLPLVKDMPWDTV